MHISKEKEDRKPKRIETKIEKDKGLSGRHKEAAFRRKMVDF